jgi:hypothetical protein
LGKNFFFFILKKKYIHSFYPLISFFSGKALSGMFFWGGEDKKAFSKDPVFRDGASRVCFCY